MAASFDAISDLWAELANPAIIRGSINKHTAFGKQISGILIGKRIAQVHTNRAQDDHPRETVALEQLLTGNDKPFFPDLKQAAD